VVYDTLGRPTGREVPGDTNWSCTGYDARGRPATATDSAGHAITNDYHDTTNPGAVTESYTDSAGAVRSVTAVIDLLGRPTSYTDEQAGTTTAFYDEVGRMTDTYRSVFGGANTRLTNLVFDAYGRPRVSSEYLSGTARTTTVDYDTGGRPNVVTLPNAVVTTSVFDGDLGYVKTLTNVAAGSVHLSDWSYLQTLGAKVVTDTNTAVRTRTFTYDAAGRLTQSVEGATTRRYAYDADTNRCALAAACDATWAYNAADQLTASPQATAYTYNSHGQLSAAARVDAKTENIGYAATDHAATVDDGTTTVAETLAPSGRVLERIVTNDATHAVTEDTLYGYAGSGDSPAYTRGAAGGSVTSYIGACVDVAGTATWQISNGHGDVVGTTDAAGAYSANPATDEFGIGAAPASRLGYLGGAERFTTDVALGVIRMGVRLYDPNLGRFLQTDPIAGGSANNYDYANQDPVNGFDLGGDISSCSDDYCGAAQAVAQASNEESPLVRSSDFYNANQNLRENNKIRNAPYYGPTTYGSAAVGTVTNFGQGAGIGAAVVAAAGTAPEDLVALDAISSVGTAATAFNTCTNKGWVTAKCGGDLAGVAIDGVSFGLGTRVKGRVTRTALHVVNAGWGYVSDWIGF
jgi:RHS repeat-associated protein